MVGSKPLLLMISKYYPDDDSISFTAHVMDLYG